MQRDRRRAISEQHGRTAESDLHEEHDPKRREGARDTGDFAAHAPARDDRAEHDERFDEGD